MKTKFFVAAAVVISLALVGCKQVEENTPIVDPTADFPEAVGFDSEGAMPGVFTIGENKTVKFSRGNLQYLSVSNTWRFANSQLAYVGSANEKIAADNASWMDLYAYGTSSWCTEVYHYDYKLHLDTLKEMTVRSYDTLMVQFDTIYNAMHLDTIDGVVDTTFYTEYVAYDTIHAILFDTIYKLIRIDTLGAYYDIDTIKSTNYMPYSTSTPDSRYTSTFVDTLRSDENLPYFAYLCKAGVYVGNYFNAATTVKDGGDLQGDNVQADWGVHNAISNGGNKAGMWRTLSKEELEYLLEKRENAVNLAGIASVADVYGLVLLPDNWDKVKPFIAGYKGGYSATNVISEADWQIFEQHGAIFLPCTGRRSQSTIHDVQEQGYYWTSTNGRMVVIFKDGVSVFETDKSNGAAVRLVKDVK